jgi:hypothetical protein
MIAPDFCHPLDGAPEGARDPGMAFPCVQQVLTRNSCCIRGFYHFKHLPAGLQHRRQESPCRMKEETNAWAQ